MLLQPLPFFSSKGWNKIFRTILQNSLKKTKCRLVKKSFVSSWFLNVVTKVWRFTWAQKGFLRRLINYNESFITNISQKRCRKNLKHLFHSFSGFKYVHLLPSASLVRFFAFHVSEKCWAESSQDWRRWKQQPILPHTQSLIMYQVNIDFYIDRNTRFVRKLFSYFIEHFVQ